MSRISPAPSAHDLAGVVDGIEAGGLAAAVGEDLPARRLARLRHALGVDGDDDALGAKFVGPLGHELTAVHGGGIDRHLVGAGVQQFADVFDRAHAAADRKRHEAALRGALDDVEDGVAVLVAGGDVEKAQLVGAGRVISGGRLDGIAGIHQVDEVDALDDAAVLDVEAGDDADLQHGERSEVGGGGKAQALEDFEGECEGWAAGPAGASD